MLSRVRASASHGALSPEDGLHPLLFSHYISIRDRVRIWIWIFQLPVNVAVPFFRIGSEECTPEQAFLLLLSRHSMSAKPATARVLYVNILFGFLAVLRKRFFSSVAPIVRSHLTILFFFICRVLCQSRASYNPSLCKRFTNCTTWSLPNPIWRPFPIPADSLWLVSLILVFNLMSDVPVGLLANFYMD